MIIKIGVSGMSCGHCSKAVSEAISQVFGVEKVEVSLEEKTATITTNVEISVDLLKDLIEDEGYTFNGIL